MKVEFFVFRFLGSVHTLFFSSESNSSIDSSSGAKVPRDLYLRNLVDPASSHMLVSKIKPCMSQYQHYHC